MIGDDAPTIDAPPEYETVLLIVGREWVVRVDLTWAVVVSRYLALKNAPGSGGVTTVVLEVGVYGRDSCDIRHTASEIETDCMVYVGGENV